MKIMGEPLGEKSHHLLHTKYFDKKNNKVKKQRPP